MTIFQKQTTVKKRDIKLAFKISKMRKREDTTLCRFLGSLLSEEGAQNLFFQLLSQGNFTQ